MFREGVFVTLAAENSSVETTITSVTEALRMPLITFSEQDQVRTVLAGAGAACFIV